MNEYIAALLFFLPAGIANSAPPIANRIPLLSRWKTPLDGGRTWRGKRVFGQNKTWRGLLCGALLGGIVAYFLFGFITDFTHSWFIGTFENFVLGALLGIGALLGDALESFFKRQRGIKPGQSWLFFDQIDYVAGAILFSLPFVRFTLSEYLVVIVVYFVLHFVVSYLGFLLGIKENPFKL